MTTDNRNQIKVLLEIDKALSKVESRYQFYGRGHTYLDEEGNIHFMTQYEANAANWQLVQYKIIQEIRNELGIPKGGYKE